MAGRLGMAPLPSTPTPHMWFALYILTPFPTHAYFPYHPPSPTTPILSL